MTLPAIRRAEPAEAEPVSALVATAFLHLPALNWLVPDSGARLETMTANLRIFVEHALEHGHVDLVDPGHAAAVWLPRTGPLPEPEDYDKRLADAVGPWLDRFTALDALFEANHPHEPHHHLVFLAVRPGHQRRGLGGALLRRHHAVLDEAGVAGYLEASSPGSRELYLRHGYRAHEPFHLPDGTPFWPMWRPPAGEWGGAG
ncbi:GNAT family N-acetyltransferase [Rhizohabitans arisaemae]|uniref:GNAT family N-acetyltransferase n=1 Tax=Rhizohabitans arisaemae TaxID=2720610 RepID=UPI0024B1B6DB|nr:GNAT family N-acetyltransferase [Rhizohabitans arisaemae]